MQSVMSCFLVVFVQYPDFAIDVIPKNQGVRTSYMNLLLGLVEALRKSPHSFSVTELSNTESELAELKEAGFKLDWLDSRLEEISLERKKLVSDGPWVKKLEEQIKSVELTLSDLKVELDKERIKSIIVSPFSSLKKIPLIIIGMVSIVTMFFLIYIYIYIYI